VDGRSDQFSLAVIAYEALTGEKPYTGEHLTTVVYKIVTEEPAPPHRINPTVGPAIESALSKALAKKPDARHRNCQEFVDELEKACAATKGWKLMPRGGSMNEPTVGESPGLKGVPAVTLPKPVRPVRLGDTTVTRGGRRKGGLLTFLLAILVAGGLLALIGFQGMPWFGSQPGSKAPQDQDKAAKLPEQAPAPGMQPTVPTPEPVPPPAAETQPRASAPPETSPAEPEKSPAAQPKRTVTADPHDKPSPMPPAREAAHRAPERAEVVQPVTVITSPSGASATLDGRSDAVCTTPCTLDAAPGRHNLSIVLGGYDVERREFSVGTGPLELPAIVLRAPGGTLMLTTVPDGATVSVNGKAIGKTTPVQLQLAPGSYRISVERDGRRATQTVQVGGGISYLKIPLEP
jgi:serine/threonine-protein kinase